MKHLARKKVVLVIVEGASDDTALGVALNQVFDKDSVYIYIMHGDITTRKGVNSQNVVSKIGDSVKGYAKSQHYKASDFLYHSMYDLYINCDIEWKNLLQKKQVSSICKTCVKCL